MGYIILFIAGWFVGQMVNADDLFDLWDDARSKIQSFRKKK